jgi:hypothetical protein
MPLYPVETPRLRRRVFPADLLSLVSDSPICVAQHQAALLQGEGVWSLAQKIQGSLVSPQLRNVSCTGERGRGLH